LQGKGLLKLIVESEKEQSIAGRYGYSLDREYEKQDHGKNKNDSLEKSFHETNKTPA
jgi:hypothetical protein